MLPPSFWRVPTATRLSRTARCPAVCRPPLAAPLQPKPHCRHSPLRQPVGQGRPPLAAPLRHPWHPLGRRRDARRAGAHHRDRQAGAEAGAGQAGGAQRARVRRGEEGRLLTMLPVQHQQLSKMEACGSQARYYYAYLASFFSGSSIVRIATGRVLCTGFFSYCACSAYFAYLRTCRSSPAWTPPCRRSWRAWPMSGGAGHSSRVASTTRREGSGAIHSKLGG